MLFQVIIDIGSDIPINLVFKKVQGLGAFVRNAEIRTVSCSHAGKETVVNQLSDCLLQIEEIGGVFPV